MSNIAASSRPAALLLLAAMSFAPSARAQFPFQPLTTIDGTRPPVEWRGTTADGAWTFRPLDAPAGDASRDVVVAANDVVVWGHPADPLSAPVAVLAGGDRTPVDDFTADAESITVTTRSLGKRTFPLSRVRGLVFRAPSSPLGRDLRFAAVAHPAEGERDRLTLVGGDALQGIVTTLDVRQVVVETALGPAAKSTLDAESLVFNPALAEEVLRPTEYVVVGLRDGTLLACSRVTGNDQTAAFEPLVAAGETAAWTVPRASVVFLQRFGGRVRYLSDVAPAGYRHVPYFRLEKKYAFDRNLAGGALRAGGKPHLKGIAMPSTSRLAFPLDPADRRLRAEIALDDVAGRQGSVTFRVFVDADERFRSDVVRGGDSPRPIDVDLAGGKQLSLVVDFAESGDVQDHAVWLDARLTR